MDPELWQRLTPLFDAALEIPKEKRSEFVVQVCGEDGELKQELERLLSANDQESDTFDDPLVNLHDFDSAKKQVFFEGDMLLGRYRIIRLIGEGGMGAVYEAEQDPPRRRVALKVIKGALASPDQLRRFKQEFQALGRLHHPGIAQIYDAGAAETAFGSQPFFAMELVHGKPLRVYADERQIDTRQRLSLMIQICDAVQHAHQRGIIHRDLKPGNMLVEESGQPKILDFGLARMTDSDVEATRQTDIGQLLGTLPYMSPEQTTGDPLALDTRSDVYALGVILYELLAGRLPYDMPQLLYEVIRTIQVVDPTPLSSVNRMYRGDIETIVSKALEKEKERRYTSPADLAADIQRYLDDKPIAAKPASTSYQLQKFSRRHKGLVAGVAVVVLVLAAGVVVSTWEAMKARRAEASAQAVNDFLQNDLLAQASASNQAGPTTKPDPDLKVRTALDRAAARVEGKFDKQPEIEAAIRDTIGQAYVDLGLYPDARKQLETALALYRRVDGANNPKTLNTALRLGGVVELQGKFAEAETLDSQTSEAMRQVLGSRHPSTLKAMMNLADDYADQGKYAQAEPLLIQTLEVDRKVLGPEHIETLRCMIALARVYDREEKYAQAEATESQTVEIDRRVLGPEHPNTLMAMNNLASSYNREGKYAQAEALKSQALDIYRRVLGPEHPSTLQCMVGLGDIYGNENKYAQAEALMNQTLEISRRVLGPESISTLYAADNLAGTYSDLGKYAQAEALYSQTLAPTREVLGPEASLTLDMLSGMAAVYQAEGKYGLAETYAAQALAGLRHRSGPDNSYTMAAANDLTLVYVSQRRFAESESLARETEKLEEGKQPDDWQRFWAESLLGASLAGQKKFGEAEPLLLEGYRGLVERKDMMAVPDRYRLRSTREWIVQMYKAWGKSEKAVEWKAK
jgi:eukaryotic-like serine/threonine-protein kinase